MPKVTEAHRRARRDEIAQAAIRVLRRRGVSNTSITQIVEESGLSAGAIYANFGNKAELARYVAENLLGWRIEAITEAAGADPEPIDLARATLASFAEGDAPAEVLLQFWGEATVDGDLRAVLTTGVGRLRTAYASALGSWAFRRDPDDADEVADRMAAALVALCQGWLANTAVLGWLTPDAYLDGVGVALGGSGAAERF